MGYRKALEFLIKDYLIKQLGLEEVDQIRKMNISTCIQKYIQSEKIKEISQRAVWLGNDETHYERKWLNKDVNDLKDLINITVYWIMMEESTKAVLQEMSR